MKASSDTLVPGDDHFVRLRSEFSASVADTRRRSRARRVGIRALGAVVAVAVLVSGAVAVAHKISEPTPSASRVRYYSSTAQLAADSTVVLIGTVIAQRSTRDIVGDATAVSTLSTVRISSMLKATSGLIRTGDVIVRQLGSGHGSSGTPLLREGRGYLLYLSPSGLDGDLATQYYITGDDAGIYIADTEGGHLPATSFTQASPDPGDTLPATISEEHALG